MSNKVVITNFSALNTKYGSTGAKKIKTALNSLIAADKTRGFDTRVIDVASSTAMKSMKGKKVSNAADPKQNKAAVDAIYKALVPDYIVLLGATDVIPHQDLRNPVFGGDDLDEFAYGDVPYACEAPYSREPKDFIGPTRVVGRLPDITGSSDSAYLVGLLATATNWKSRPRTDYGKCFAITAQVWKKSTTLSIQKLFGSSADLQLSPPKGPNWTPAQLGRLAHFVNCHGAPSDPTFYGQKGKNNFPIAHLAANVEGKVAEGTVASIECCYGAELYDPAGGQSGICSTYLGGKAYGYFGSSTIAYGPADSNGSADLICQYFIRRILAGASLGRAALEARLEFTGGAAELDPVDLKTIAQFNLLGDPSIHPVAMPVTHTAVAQPKGLAGVAKAARAAIADATVARTDRRRQLLARGLRIGATQAVATKVAKPMLAGGVLSALKKMAAQLEISAPTILSFKVETPVSPKGPMALAMRGGPIAKMAAPSAFHVITGKQPVSQEPAPQIIALVAKEVAGKIVSFREMHSR
jgi:hypothetical protein